MTTQQNILIIGENPNLAYYGWKLYDSKSCNITIVNSLLDPASQGIIWVSDQGKKARYNPERLYKNVSQLPQGVQYDVILLSSSSLHTFSLCNQLAPFLGPSTVVVIESTGFLQLESYIQQHFHKVLNREVACLSIMNDSDVKKIPNHPIYVLQQRNKADYLYIGNATSAYQRLDIIAIDGLSKLFAKAAVETLKTDNNLEFFNYQWKFALPRLVFNPLLLVFELDHPVKISKQILAKPLISGLFNESIELLKKMDCKLIKGYENENSLLNTWCKLYPERETAGAVENVLSQDFGIKDVKYLNSPNFFYEFYHQYVLDFDLLLLQPILVADDYAIKTPYLEFLYTTMSQFEKLNHSTLENPSSLFFLRSTSALKSRLLNLTNVDNMENKIMELINKNRSLEDSNQNLIKQINELSYQLNSQRMQVGKISQERNSLQQQLRPPGSRRQSLNGQMPVPNTPNGQSAVPQKSPSRMSFNNQSSGQLNFDALYQPPKPVASGANSGSTSSEDLQDLAEMAMIGAKLNGEYRSRTPSPNPAKTQPAAQQPPRVNSFTNVKKLNMQAPIKTTPNRNGKRMVSNQSSLPTLEAQANFMDKPFGNSNSYLPMNDVSSRFTPQSRKNRKSGMPLLSSRASSGTNLAQMLQQPPNGGNHTSSNSVSSKRDMNDYSLYGGALPPNGIKSTRNRVSSHKSLNHLANGYSQGDGQPGGPSGSGGSGGPSGSGGSGGPNGHYNGPNGTHQTSNPSQINQTNQINNPGQANQSSQTPAGFTFIPRTPQVTSPEPQFTNPVPAFNNENKDGLSLPTADSSKSNDSKVLFSDGVFSNNNNNSSIETQHTNNGTYTKDVAPPALEKSASTISRTSTGKKKKLMKLFFGRKKNS